MDRRYERDRDRYERGWKREWSTDRDRDSENYRGAYGEGEQYGSGQRDFSDSSEPRYSRSGARSAYSSEWDYGDHGYGSRQGGEYGRSSPYYGAMTYRDQQRYGGGSGSSGYGSGGDSGERWRSGSSARDFGDRQFRGSGDTSPAWFGTGGYYGGFSGGNTGRDEWGGRFGEGRLRESAFDDDRFRNEYGGGESGRTREGQGQGLLSRLFKRGPKGYARSDERIREDISERLYNNPYVDSSEVSVNVSAGKVTLEGTVPNRWMRHAIENEADRCSGVRDIDNNIRVQQSDESQTGTTTGSQSATSGSTTTSRSKLS